MTVQFSFVKSDIEPCLIGKVDVETQTTTYAEGQGAEPRLLGEQPSFQCRTNGLTLLGLTRNSLVEVTAVERGSARADLGRMVCPGVRGV